MSWIKNVLIDIAATVIIVVYALNQPEWAWWVIAIYTPLMLLLKLTALSSGVAAMVKSKSAEVPAWFHHAVYAISFGALLYSRWWWAAGAWAAIWVVSVVIESRSGSKS